MSTLSEINKQLTILVEKMKTAILVPYQIVEHEDEYAHIQASFDKVLRQIEMMKIIDAGIKCNNSPDEMVKDFHTLNRLYLHLREEHYKMVSQTILHRDWPTLKNKYST